MGPVTFLLQTVTAGGTHSCGTFYCFTGHVQNSLFNSNINIIGDSFQTFVFNNSSFLEADNLFQTGSFDFQNNRFGQSGKGTTVLKAALNVAAGVYIRDGNNTFWAIASGKLTPLRVHC